MRDFTFYTRIKMNIIKHALFIALFLSLFLCANGINAQQALSGAYTVDASITSPTNFANISAMAAALNKDGVSGPVTITVANGVYNEALSLGAISGASAVNNIVIDGGDSSQTILTQNGSISFATLVFDGTKYVHVKNMGIRMTKSGAGAAVIFAGSAAYDTLSNCATWVNPSVAASTLVNVSFSTITTANRNNTTVENILLQNNHIIGGNSGIKAAAHANAPNSHNKVYYNTIDSVYLYGIHFLYQNSFECVGNSVDATNSANVNSTYTQGVFIQVSNNTVLSSNYIWAQSYGVYLNNYNKTALNTAYHISNNMIYSERESALRMNYLSSVNIWNNSFNSESEKGPTVYIFTDVANPTVNYDMRNNILSSKYIEVLSVSFVDTSVFIKFDNNLYYNESGSSLITIADTTYSSLADYKLAQPLFNTASIEIDPTFKSSTDLHIFGITPYEGGDKSVPISVDIDGDSRPGPNSIYFDIGADEFVPPACPFPMGVGTSNPELDAITIHWTAGSQGSTFQYNIVPCGVDSSNGTKAFTTQDSLRVVGLSPNACYQLYVRDVCGRDSSIWRGPVDFYTALGVPYFENFESFTPGNMLNPWPYSWTSVNYATSTVLTLFEPRWVSDSATGIDKNTANTGPLYDHTQFGSPGGRYMYVSSRRAALVVPPSSDSADFFSAPIYVDSSMTAIRLNFWYFMYGADIDLLKVIVDTNGVENTVATFIGQQQASQMEAWRDTSIFLHGYEGKKIVLKFRGYPPTGNISRLGDVAIDDISVEEAYQTNTGVVDMVFPSEVFCAGNIQPVVAIGNLGSKTIDSVNVVWNVNGIKDSIAYKGTLQAGDTAHLKLGNVFVNGAQANNLVFHTSLPNGQVDFKKDDDSLVFENITIGLNGAYTLDPNQTISATNFTSFDSLSTFLSKYGLCGPTTINVAAGVYKTPIHLRKILGASATNNLVIDGIDSSQTIVTHDGSERFSTLTLDHGANHVHVKNMTFKMTAATGSAVLFASNPKYDTLSNCVIWVDPSNTAAADYNIGFSGNARSVSAGAAADYIVVQNNLITGGYYGIRAEASAAIPNVSIQILNNIIDSVRYRGMYFHYQDALEIAGNSIDVLRNGVRSTTGIEAQMTSNTRISRNYVWATNYGVYMINNTIPAPITRRYEISNNMIYAKNQGLRLLYVDSVNIYHNSVYSEGTAAADHAVYIYQIASIPISSYDIRNNIFSAKYKKAFFFNANYTIFDHFDHNIFYAPNDNLIEDAGRSYANLVAYQLADTINNAASLEVDPMFNFTINPIDLHMSLGVAAKQAGDNSVGITVDIDGDIRPASGDSIVDIGADEFTPKSCPSSLFVNLVGIDTTSAIAKFNSKYTSTTKEYVLVSCGDSRSGGTVLTATSDSVLLTGLTPHSCYEFYIRETCVAGDTSAWSGPFGFTTAQIPIYYPIGIINTSDLNGLADSVNVSVWTSGTVVGVDLNATNGLGFTIIDMSTGSQEGIYIHSFSPVSNYSVTEGDSIKVLGRVDQFNGLTQVVVDSMAIISTGNYIPTPIVVTTLGESTESQYLKMKNFILLDSSQTGSYNMRAYNGTNTITIRINAQTDMSDSLSDVNNSLVARDTICLVLGVGTQFDPTSPYTAGYQITPMRYSDLTICKDVTIGVDNDVQATDNLTFYPNPNTGSFTIATSGLQYDNAMITIRDISGKVIIRENIINSSNAFKKQYTLEGQAKGLYLISIIDGNKSINKKLILQ